MLRAGAGGDRVTLPPGTAHTGELHHHFPRGPVSTAVRVSTAIIAVGVLLCAPVSGTFLAGALVTFAGLVARLLGG